MLARTTLGLRVRIGSLAFVYGDGDRSRQVMCLAAHWAGRSGWRPSTTPSRAADPVAVRAGRGGGGTTSRRRAVSGWGSTITGCAAGRHGDRVTGASATNWASPALPVGVDGKELGLSAYGGRASRGLRDSRGVRSAGGGRGEAPLRR